MWLWCAFDLYPIVTGDLQAITSIRDFQHQLLLMFTNAIMYNTENEYVFVPLCSFLSSCHCCSYNCAKDMCRETMAILKVRMPSTQHGPGTQGSQRFRQALSSSRRSQQSESSDARGLRSVSSSTFAQLHQRPAGRQARLRSVTCFLYCLISLLRTPLKQLLNERRHRN